MRPAIGDPAAVRRCLVACLLGACAAPAPPPTMQPPSAPVAAAPAARTTLAPNERLALGGGVTVHFSNVTVESIAASPDGSYPAGSGITLALIFEGLGAPVSREISLLSAGYESVREAWFDRYRVEVVEVEDPTRAPRLVVVAEQVTERVRPGEPIAARVQRGGEVELGSTRMKFLGHSTKHIEAGEPPPLLVAVEYQPFRAAPERLETHVGTEERPQRWRWRDYLFTIEAQAFDAWLQLSIARLELEPVQR
ncbi:hypothetical protein [Nannocystis punicea]|uniref:Lipoprotein n=1 Tax=Nannocystis punicea TaxID=2995304 RepID=A0ABY7GVS3_9BACT|nr:hypothetical protein [Nannocystis poenicansa]WAS91056.1 hypothetical protein O0S08_33120 [Nannocystis poenicansa]